MQAVNLLPAYARPGSRWASAGKDLAPARVLTLGGAVAAAAAVAVGALYLHERSVVNTRRADLTDAKSRLAAQEAIAAPLRAASEESTARADAVQSVVGTRIAWQRVMVDLARVFPTQSYLQSMQIGITAPGESPPVDPTTGLAIAGTGVFTITGTAASQVRVALVMDQLATLPWLSGITLTSSARTGTTGGDTFQISATFTETGTTP